MIFRPYKLGDLAIVAGEQLSSILGWDADLESKVCVDSAWTGIADDEIIGCGGFNRYWQGVYEAWVMAKSAEIFQQYRLSVIRFIKARFKELPAHRIQATILASNEVDNRFIQFLKFRFDTVLDSYGPSQQDYNLYSIVK